MFFLKLLILLLHCIFVRSKDYKAIFDVQLSDDERGSFTILVHEDWAPLGADRFRELCEAKYFDDGRFFRVIDNFMAQFGIAADPAMSAKHRKKVIRDDAVIKSNKPGMLTFATSGKNTRSTQLFINFKDNAYLDAEGFTPIGETIEGFENVSKIHSGYKERPDQGIAQNRGNEYLAKDFPKLSWIHSIKIVDLEEEEKPKPEKDIERVSLNAIAEDDESNKSVKSFIYIVLSIVLLGIGFFACIKLMSTKETKNY